MNLIDVFIVSFLGSFAGTLSAFVIQYWLYKKQKAQMEKVKKSMQQTVRRLKREKP